VLRRRDPSQEAVARAYLDTLVGHLARRGVRAEAQIGIGRVADVVLREARRVNADAILLGETRRPAMVRSVLGSTSNAIARAAGCEVILVERDADNVGQGQLLSFVEAAGRVGPVARRLPRLTTVEVVHIVGSVGRAKELGSDFRPRRGSRRKHDEQRFDRIRNALDRGHILPPVELYQLGSGFYVLDGHHRVAAALLNGQPEIDAVVVDHIPPRAA
jgi:hypothetical protein